MIADGRVENVQILFCIIAKRKPNKPSILCQLQKKEQCKYLALSCLGEEIDIYLSTGKLYVKSLNRGSLFVSENVDVPTEVSQKNALREKYPYSEFFWSIFSRTRTQYGEVRSISSYSVQMRENMDQKSFEYGHFSLSDNNLIYDSGDS